MSRGYVYILTNEAMPGLVKIGMTIHAPESRAKALYQTGVPFPFDVYGFELSPDCQELEAMCHSLLAECRVNESREFFLCEPAKAGKSLRQAHVEQMSCWIEEFLPDHDIDHVDNFIDAGGFKPSFYNELSAANIAPPDFAGVLHELEGFEIARAIQRFQTKCKKRRKDREQRDTDREASQ